MASTAASSPAIAGRGTRTPVLPRRERVLVGRHRKRARIDVSRAPCCRLRPLGRRARIRRPVRHDVGTQRGIPGLGGPPVEPGHLSIRGVEPSLPCVDPSNWHAEAASQGHQSPGIRPPNLSGLAQDRVNPCWPSILTYFYKWSYGRAMGNGKAPASRAKSVVFV